MADKKVTVTIEAVDKASQVIGNISKQLENLASIGGKGGKELLSTSGAVTTLAKGFQFLDKHTRKGGSLHPLKSYGKALSEIGSIASGVGKATLAFGQGFLSVTEDVSGADLSLQGLIKTGLNYDQTLERIKIKSKKAGETTKKHDSDMQKLDTTMKQLTTDTIYSMDQVAGAAELMAQNGRSATEIMQELPNVLKLATAGNLELGRAGEIVAGTMNMFKRQGITSADVANMLGTAANSSGASVENLAKTLENCGPQAAAMNIPFHEVIGTISLLGDRMIKGGKAGTTLKNFFQRMNNPTKAAAKAIKEFGLETAQAEIQNGHLGKGLIEMQRRFNELEKTGKKSTTEINAAMKDLAGSYGDAGLNALMKIDPAEIMARFEAIKNGVVDVDSLMNTSQGQMMKFAANVQLLGYNIAKSFEGGFTSAMNVLNKFMAKLNTGEGLASALSYLEKESAKLPQILSNAIGNAINSINNFVNGGSLDSIFQIGTNIITGICNGIINNADKINSAVTGFIGKFADFITTNGPQIAKAAGVLLDALKNGITNNREKIDAAARSVMTILNTSLDGQQNIILEAGKTMAVPLAEGFILGVGQSFINVGGQVVSAIVTSVGQVTVDVVNAGKDLASKFFEGFLGKDTWEQCKTDLKGTMDWLWELQGANNTTSKAEDAGLRDGGKYTSKTKEGIDKSSGTVKQSATDMADGAATAIESRLNTMDVQGLKQLETEFKNLQTTTGTVASGIATNFTNIANSARTNFLSLANITRSQMLNATNIVRSQCVNMANISRNQFVSMANVARNQMVNISNIIRNQAMSWSNVIRNQASNARNALTSSFMSMAAVARTQMARVLSVVQSYMNQISAACNKTLTLKVNINKTETTTKKVVEQKVGLNLAVPQTSSFTASGTRGASNSIGLGSLAQAMSGYGKDQTISISVPVVLEGREIAKASAIYTREELSRLEKRNNRKRGE